MATLRHQRAARELGWRLLQGMAARPDLELFPAPSPLTLGPEAVVEPDLFIISRPPASAEWGEVSRPILAVEVVAPDTAFRDRGVRRRLYQRAGVHECWIVDLDARVVERWRPDDERPEILSEVLAWRPPDSAAGLEIDLPHFFAAVLDR
jgi:Uma2 family endonuclease